MSAPRTFALTVALLLGAGAAGAEASGGPEPSAAPASERGLQPRIQLSRQDERDYGNAPSVAAAPSRPAEPVAPEEDVDLLRHLALNLRPVPLRSPSEAGRRLGHGDFVLSVPLNRRVDLRTGVRVDYDSSPVSETFHAQATPTLGVGFEF